MSTPNPPRATRRRPSTLSAPKSLALTDAAPALIEQWLAWKRADGASANTIQTYRRSIDQFVDWLRESGHAGTVTPSVVLAFKGALAQRYSVQTVNLRLSAVRSFYRWMVVTERLATSPAESISGLKRSNSRQHKRDALTSQEVTAVLDACRADQSLAGVRDRAMLTLMAYCGLREVEVHRANLGNLKTQGDRLVLEVQGKGRREADEIAVIPLSQEEVIRGWLAHRRTFASSGADDPLFVSLSNRTRGQRLSTRGIRQVVARRFQEAGVVGERKSAHSLRHSAITSAIRHGAEPIQVQAMARHSSFDTTLGYYHEVARTEEPAEDFVSYETP